MMRLTTRDFSNPLGQAFWVMRALFTVAPILFRLDTFFNFMVDWATYLAPWIPNLIHVSPQTFMRGVGVIEIGVGILVGFWPHIFAYVAAVWLWGIILNLATLPGDYDIALRDFGLSIGALALARLAHAHQLEVLGQVEVEPVATRTSVQPSAARGSASLTREFPRPSRL